MMSNKITNFDDEHLFLSNFQHGPLIYNGIHYQNSESAYQAQKCDDPADMEKFTTLEPMKAKKLARKLTHREDWDKIKEYTMYEIVREKFKQNPELAQKLIQTKDKELIEENYWNDRYWGVCDGTGDNRLGKILMTIRAKLINERK